MFKAKSEERMDLYFNSILEGLEEKIGDCDLDFKVISSPNSNKLEIMSKSKQEIIISKRVKMPVFLNFTSKINSVVNKTATLYEKSKDKHYLYLSDILNEIDIADMDTIIAKFKEEDERELVLYSKKESNEIPVFLLDLEFNKSRQRMRELFLELKKSCSGNGFIYKMNNVYDIEEYEKLMKNINLKNIGDIKFISPIRDRKDLLNKKERYAFALGFFLRFYADNEKSYIQ